MPGMSTPTPSPAALLTVQAPARLTPRGLAGPYPLLSLLRASALLRPTLDDATGPARVALSLTLVQAEGGRPAEWAAVLLSRGEGAPPQQAAQIADRHGVVCFGWSGPTLAEALRPALTLSVYLIDDGHVRGIASAPLAIVAGPQAGAVTHGLARHTLTLDPPPWS